MIYPRKTIGVIGGLGPQATVNFLDRLVQKMHEAYRKDTFPLPIIDAYVLPGLEFLTKNSSLSESEEYIKKAIRHFRGEADIVVSPCNTINAYISEINLRLPFEYIDIIPATARAVVKKRSKSVYLLATTFTVQSGKYQQLLTENSIVCSVPTVHISKRITRLIRDVTSYGVNARNTRWFMALMQQVRRHHTGTIVLGCTELCLFPQSYGTHVVNSLESLAAAALEAVKRE